jgi:hypothetical protein
MSIEVRALGGQGLTASVEGLGTMGMTAAAAARRGTDAAADGLIADLLAAGPEFARYWDEMTVEPLRSMRKRLIHPHAGELDVQCDIVLSVSTGHRLLMFRPQPGSATAANFEFLNVLGEQTFDA